MILALNGGSTSTQLGDWLAVTFPNMYGINAGDNDLTGQDNAYVAAFYQRLFGLTINTTPGGPAKLEAEVLSVALATYVTNSTLAGDAAVEYGFAVSEDGLAAEVFNVGVCGDAFDVDDHSLITVMDLLLATDANSDGGLLYDVDDSGTLEEWEIELRYLADDVYAAICETK